MSDGYKTAPFGLIPKEWNLVQLDSLIQVDRPITYGIVQPGSYDASGKFLVRGKDYSTKWSKAEEFFRVSEKVELPYKRARLKTNDLIITIVGYVGKTQIVPAWLEGANITQTTARIAIDESKGFYKFFYYVLCSHIGRYSAKFYEKGGAQLGLNLSDVKRFLVPVPSLREQHKIAEILSTVDEKIDVINDQITETQKLKKGLMQQLLTRGIGHKRFKMSPLGEIPESWEVDLLDNVAKRGSGHTPNKNHPEYYNGETKWVSLSDSNKLDRRWITNTKTKISQQGIDNSSAVLHSKGTVILSRDAGVGKSAIMIEQMAVSQHFITWTCSNKLSNWFLYYILQLHKPLFERIAIGSTIKTIGLPFFKKFKVSIPSMEEQKRIADILYTVDDKLEILNTKKNSYLELKQALMQQLLTGKIRVTQSNNQNDKAELRSFQTLTEMQ